MATSTTVSSSTSKTNSQSTTKNVLDTALRDVILSGLRGYMTDEEIGAFAENLLRPTLNAGLEASQQNYEASKLGYEQEIENLAAQLAQAIDKQQQSYRQSDAGLETAALARGMGRSSYLLDAKTQLSRALSDTIRSLTDESTRQSGQIQQKITLAGQQNAQTQGRLNTDYASQLAAKVQELKDAQRQEYNQNYMTATSAAMGSQTIGSSTTDTNGTSVTTTSGGGGGRSSKKTAENTYTVDEYVSGSTRRDPNIVMN